MVIGEDLGHSPLLQSVAMRTGKEGEREREEDLPFCVLLYNLPSVFTLSFINVIHMKLIQCNIPILLQ